jgi:signal transduction histidine kinase
MRAGVWPADTVARRFIVAEVLTIGATLALIGLFNLLGGVWSREPLSNSGLLNHAADLLRIIEVAPPEMRERLSAAATSNDTYVDWYAANSLAAASLNGRGRVDSAEAIDEMFARTHRVATLKPGERAPFPAGLTYRHGKTTVPYLLAVQLSDGSWLAFTVMDRVWGMSRIARWGIWLVFITLSIALVSTFTARQFAKPIKQLAEAVRQFGMNPLAPPMTETGPRELRQVVRTFNGMQAQIQKFVAYRTMMLAAISHDLRTPLTRIRLRGEFIADEEQQARLFRDVDEMQLMVDGALALFRDDAIAEEITSFDLPQLLLTISNDYADQNIELKYSGPAHAAYKGRPFALKRAVTNLIENAIKYATVPDLGLSREAASFIVTVTDRGPGIPSDALDSVFRPYHRLDKSRHRTTGGVGLGLTVAQAIVQGHGGQISLINRPDGGLEARMVLPIGA